VIERDGCERVGWERKRGSERGCGRERERVRKRVSERGEESN